MASHHRNTIRLLPASYVAMSPGEERTAVEAVAALLGALPSNAPGGVDAAAGLRSHPSSPSVPARREGGDDELGQADDGPDAEG